MAIQAGLETFICQIRKKIGLCSHNAAYSIFRFGKYGEARVQQSVKATEFADWLQQSRSRVGEYDPRKAVPPHLYDIFGFFLPCGNLIHSAIVVDELPPVILAECTNLLNWIGLNKLEEVLNHQKQRRHFVSLFPASLVAESLRSHTI